MGTLVSYLERRLSSEIDARKVLVWYDPDRQWEPWVQQLRAGAGGEPDQSSWEVSLAGSAARLIVFDGSHYQAMLTADTLLDEGEAGNLLVYVPGVPHNEGLSPLREFECLGGEKEPYQRDLRQVARQAFQDAKLAESKIDEILNHEGLTFEYLDKIAGEGAAKTVFDPIFGSGREVDVFPAFLAKEEKREQVASHDLLPEIIKLAEGGLGIGLPAGEVADVPRTASAQHLADRIARQLLVSEMRSDLEGAEPTAISQLPRPETVEQVGRVRSVCERLRKEHPDHYEQMADKVERDLGLASAGIDPLALGHIDTFRFEAHSLLAGCDELLAKGEPDKSLEVVEARANSFWTSISRHPKQHAAWEAARDLAQLAIAIGKVEVELAAGEPSKPKDWVQAYSSEEGWHRVDQLFRQARYRLSRMEDDAVLEKGRKKVFGQHEALVTRLAEGFIESLEKNGWTVEGSIGQTEIFSKVVQSVHKPTAYFLADAMRFEMGAELAELVGGEGAEAVRLEPAVGSVPTITVVGMAALVPGAEKSFSIVPTPPKGITGAIGGQALVGSAQRMEHAKAEVPGLVEMTLDRLCHQLSKSELRDTVSSAPVVIVRSQEIDGAGENLSSGLAQTVMGTVLEGLRRGILKLADAGIERFVIAADHGHLFAQTLGEDMRINLPEGGETVDAHRRCWVGRGGSTPPACARIAGRDWGYDTDLDIVVPKGRGVFKTGGDLAYHHGGLSLQELIIPVLSFELIREAPKKKAGLEYPIAIEGVPSEINNMIFSVTVRRVDLPMEPIHMRLLAQTSEGRTVGQACFAEKGWDSEKHVITLENADPVSVGIQLDDEEALELRVLAIEVGTDRTLKDTTPIPVKRTR